MAVGMALGAEVRGGSRPESALQGPIRPGGAASRAHLDSFPLLIESPKRVAAIDREARVTRSGAASAGATISGIDT